MKEKLGTMVSSNPEDPNAGPWPMVYHTYARFNDCLDRISQEQGLTAEQYFVIVNIKFHDPPVRITDLAQSLGRTPNSASMIVDRMVKAGLLKRVRDRRDRRVVTVLITSKAEDAFKKVDIGVRKLIQQIMSPLSYEDRHTFDNLFKMMNYKMLEYLNPGADIEEILRNETKRRDKLMKRWLK